MSTTLHEYDQHADDERAHTDYWAQTRQNILGSWVSESDPNYILDIGCGSGYLARYLGRKGRYISGVDLEKEFVSQTSARPGVNSALIGNATQLPYATSSFDCIVLGDILEHFEDPLPVVRESNRVLSSDGTLLVSVPACPWLWGPHDEHNDHAERYTLSRLSELVDKVGFQVTKHRYTNFLPLPIYFVLQRVFCCAIPENVRGGHNKGIEQVKKAFIWLETNVSFPVGITLLAKCRRITHS
jgi:SAM-dependent methyltransferase